MGGGSIQDAKLVVVGGGAGIPNQGFYSINGTDFTEINESSFNQTENFLTMGIGYNTTSDNQEPKWAVVAGLSPGLPQTTISYNGFYSHDGKDWNIIPDASYFLETGNLFSSIASDSSKNWVAVGNDISFNPLSITSSSIDTSNSWTSFDLSSSLPDALHTYNSVDYFQNHWICVGKIDDGLLSLGGVWVSSTEEPDGSWNFINDTSYSQNEYTGVGHDISGRWMVVGSNNSAPFNGKAYYSAQVSNPVDSSWTEINDPKVDISNTAWLDTDYSPVHDRWVIVGLNSNSGASIVYSNSGDLQTWNVADISDPDLSGFKVAYSVVWDNTFNKFYCVGARLNNLGEYYGVIAESISGEVWQKTESNYDASQNFFYAIGTSSPNQ